VDAGLDTMRLVRDCGSPALRRRVFASGVLRVAPVVA
jgi:hypothetical protein